MIVVTKDSGAKFVPPGHAGMEARHLFGPHNGSRQASVHLSTLAPGGGMADEVHPGSDQVFYVLSGSIQAYSAGRHAAGLGPGDAVHVPAGDPHAFRNEGAEPCRLYVITVPPVASKG